jgi:hypothetical protein
VAAAVADVGLDVDGVELGADERAGRADVEAGGVRSVLADVGGHESAHVARCVARDSTVWLSMNATCRQVEDPSAPVLS